MTLVVSGEDSPRFLGTGERRGHRTRPRCECPPSAERPGQRLQGTCSLPPVTTASPHKDTGTRGASFTLTVSRFPWLTGKGARFGGTLDNNIALSSQEPASEAERDAQSERQAQRVASEPPPGTPANRKGGREHHATAPAPGREKAASLRGEPRPRRRPRAPAGTWSTPPGSSTPPVPFLVLRRKRLLLKRASSIPSVHLSIFSIISRRMRVSPAAVPVKGDAVPRSTLAVREARRVGPG